MVNGLIIPRRYVDQVTSPDILPPDFKNPYLYVPTHLCSQTLCIQLLFPLTLMYPHLYIFWRYVPIFFCQFWRFPLSSFMMRNLLVPTHGKSTQSFYLLFLHSCRANWTKFFANSFTLMHLQRDKARSEDYYGTTTIFYSKCYVPQIIPSS